MQSLRGRKEFVIKLPSGSPNDIGWEGRGRQRMDGRKKDEGTGRGKRRKKSDDGERRKEIRIEGQVRRNGRADKRKREAHYWPGHARGARVSAIAVEINLTDYSVDSVDSVGCRLESMAGFGMLGVESWDGLVRLSTGCSDRAEWFVVDC